MKKELKIYHIETGQVKRPTEEVALNRIMRVEKQRRHDINLSRFTGWWHGRYWHEGKPQR